MWLEAVNILLRKLRETTAEDRWVYGVILTEIAISAYLIWSLA